MYRFTLLIIFVLISVGIHAQIIDENYYDGKIFLRIEDGISPIPESLEALSSDDEFREIYAIFKNNKVTKIERPFIKIRTDEFDRTYRVKFENVEDIDNLIIALERLEEVQYAEKEPIMRKHLIPNDPRLTDNNGNVIQYGLELVRAFEAFDIHTGGNAVVAVVDDAVDVSHADLAPNIWVNPGEIPNNSIDDDGNGYVDDINGWDTANNDSNPSPNLAGQSHGTHVAGIAGAATNNNLGVASIGFNTKIMAIKGTNFNGNLEKVWEGVAYAIASGADVINCSWGGGGFSQTHQNLCTQAFSENIVMVAAAGNDNNDNLHYPASYDNVIAVSNTNEADLKSSSSSYGTWVDIAAPGTNILSTYPLDSNGNETYGNATGTSMASPMVAGLCGLMKSSNPTLTPTDIENCLKSTSVNINNLNPLYSGLLGEGRIDAYAAMICASPNVAPIVSISSNDTIVCPGVTVQFNDDSFFAESWSWSFPGGQPSTSSLENPTILYDTPGTYNVELTASNDFGSTTQTFNAYIVVDQGVSEVLFEDDFESGGLGSWTVESDGGEQWQVYDINSGTERLGDKVAGMINYSGNSLGARDAIISPTISLLGRTSLTLELDHAYRKNIGSDGDSLIITASVDGGLSYPYTIFRNAEGNSDYAVATFIQINGEFNGTSELEWCGNGFGADCIIADISYLSTFSEVKIKIENYSNQGNNIYIDNFKIIADCATTSINEVSDIDGDISLFPNPNSGQFTLQFDNWNENNPRVQIFDILGREIMNQEFDITNTFTKYFDYQDQNPGTYFIKISVDGRSMYKKVIIH